VRDRRHQFAALGLQAALRDGSFEEEVTRVVLLGGDTDTNAAVAGALVGVKLGRSALPQAWLEKLQDREAIEEEARFLMPLAAMGSGEGRG
jgi:ADP-ribosylglycohydrolase